MLHVSRPVRWDSDHVVVFDDELQNIARELVEEGAAPAHAYRPHFFDGSINRVAAWVIGTRNTIKALLGAMLEPVDALRQAELEGDYTTRLALSEEFKSYPLGAVWDYYCAVQGAPVRESWLPELKAYEQGVLASRKGEPYADSARV